MKCLLVALNAKYIHSNPGVYSLKTYAEAAAKATVQGGLDSEGCGLPPVCVEIGEYTINNQMERVLEDIYRRKPDVVGISCYIWNIVPAMDLAHDLHKVLPDADLWLGGPEVSFDAPKLLVREPEILGVMKGEGEETFAGLMECYRKLGCSLRRYERAEGKKSGKAPTDDVRSAELQRDMVFWRELAVVAGLTYKDPGGRIHDQAARPVMDMDKIPFLYQDLEGFEHRIVYYESSRGCPFSCSYCLSSIDKSVRFRDVGLVKQELDFFLARRVAQVKFVDRTFNCKKSHAMAIWQHILERDNGVTNFHFEIAADLLDDEALELIGQMRPGLIQLEIGVQSANPDTLYEIRRKMDLTELRRVVERIDRRHNVHQHLDLIAGLPYEDYESFRNSFNKVYGMRPDQLQLGFLKVLKGSHMYEMAQEYGLVYRELPPYEVLSTKWLSYDDVLRLKGIEDMVEVYYNSGQFMQTLKRLEPLFPDAFSLYETLAGYYGRRKLTERNHSRLARYEILHAFIKEELPKADLELMEDEMMVDLYLRENVKSRPSFAPDQMSYKEQVRSQIPGLRALGTQIHAEVLHSGELVIFDYREKDLLTKNAAVVKKQLMPIPGHKAP